MSILSEKCKDVFYQPGEIVVIPPHRIGEYSNIGFMECDGSLVLQNTYPKLFEETGFILDDYAYTSSTNELGFNQFAIAYANNRYLRGSASNVYISFDGTTWNRTNTSTITTNYVTEFIYANNTYLYTAAGGVIGYSNSANSWSIANTNTTLALQSIAFGANVFVVVGNGGKILTSPNGVVWTSQTANGTTSTIYSVQYINDEFIYCGAGEKIAVSSNGEYWVSKNNGTASTLLRSITYGKGKYVICTSSGTLYTSTDRNSWKYVYPGYGLGINDICYNNGMFVSVGETGYIAISHNGEDWFYISNTTSPLQGLNYTFDRFTIVGNNGFMATNKYITYNSNTEFLLPKANSNIQYYKVMIKVN